MLRSLSRSLLPLLAFTAAFAALLVTIATSHGSSLSTAAQTTSPAAVPHTVQRVVRPVTAAGAPAAGYSVTRQSGRLDCADQSQTAVSRRIDTCYPSAFYAPACWRSSDHTALCLRAADIKELVRIRYAGTFRQHRALPTAQRMPQVMRLADGERCTVRVGGAWGEAPGHPAWVGFYSCTHGSVYGTLSSHGIDRSHPVWTVHELIGDDSIVTRRVTKATYVGTAA